MPDTVINISLGVQTITFEDSGAVMPKILNLIQGDNITFESSVDPLDPTKVNLTINSTGGDPPTESSRLILNDVRDFSANPLTIGNSFSFPTTMAVGKQLKDFFLKTTGIATSNEDVVISISIEADSVDFVQVNPIYANTVAGMMSMISVTNPTTEVNRNLVFTAIGGDVIGGTIEEIVAEFLK